MTGSFILDYFILVFWASCSVFQLAAAFNGIHGLLFFQDRRLSALLGLASVAGAFAWFFLSSPRNVPDAGPGLNGNEQFGYFFAGSGAGLAFTLLVSSWRNRELGRGVLSLPSGIDALRESNYLRALHRTLRLFFRPWGRPWKRS